MTQAIEIQGIRKTYKAGTRGEIQALKGLDLTVEEGTVFGCIGPNGAGKTTCIKILSGLAWQTSGHARVFGHPTGSLEARARLGYLPEIANYHDFMAVEELLMTHAELAGVPSGKLRKACNDALEAVSLQHRKRSRIRELSKGMQQRFGIAQAMVGEPRLLILDEPTSGLDPLAQKEVKDVIHGLRGRGITIFFSSHKLTEVETICDMIGILHKGQLLRLSTLDALVETGRHVEVRYRGDVTFSGPFERLAVSRVSAGDGATAGLRSVLVDPDQTDAVLDQIHQGGGSIQMVMPERMTLENAFFHLIQQSDAQAPKQEGA